MKIYKCDVCGEYFDPKKEKFSSPAESPLAAPGYAGMAMSGLDVCARCADVCKTVNFKQAMLAAWKAAVFGE